MQGDGVDDRLFSSYQSNQYITEYHSVNQFTFANKYISMSGSLLSQLFYNNGSGLRAYNLGNVISFVSSSNTLQFYTSDYAISGEVRTNNTNIVTGNLTANAPNSGKSLFEGGGVFANAIINTFIACKFNNNSTQKTGMYNYIRSINNTAF